MTAALEESGLYPKEAAAMVETWRDSWFEPGIRVIYLMPRATIDKVLLHQSERSLPKESHKVFVGRVEMLAPTERQ